MKTDNFTVNKSIALLLDPDKAKGESLRSILTVVSENNTDYILVGGSITFSRIDLLIRSIKEKCNIPVILFPGNLLQLSHDADAIFLS